MFEIPFFHQPRELGHTELTLVQGQQKGMWSFWKNPQRGLQGASGLGCGGSAAQPRGQELAVPGLCSRPSYRQRGGTSPQSFLVSPSWGGGRGLWGSGNERSK